jgi:hypothetical protein
MGDSQITEEKHFAGKKVPGTLALPEVPPVNNNE